MFFLNKVQEQKKKWKKKNNTKSAGSCCCWDINLILSYLDSFNQKVKLLWSSGFFWIKSD